MKVKKENLFVVAGLVWLLAGLSVTSLGIAAFGMFSGWFFVILAAGALVILVLFGGMFHKMMAKHLNRIRGYEENRLSVFLFFDVRGYVIMFFMMVLGFGLRVSGFAPDWFVAFFYTGLGLALSMAGVCFLIELFDKDGVNDVADGDTVKLQANIDVDGTTLTVPAGKTVTLDLNGCTLSGKCNASQGHLFMVENTATLNIKDSSSSGNGKMTYAQGTSNVGWAIDLEGNLNLYSGTIELTGSSWSIGYAVDVRPNSWGIAYTEGTVFTMYGGKLVSSDAAVRVASSSADGHGGVSASFVMEGGVIEAAWDGIFIQQSNGCYDILNVEIKDGKVSSPYAPIRFYGPAPTSAVGNAETPIKVDISGGTFDYTGTDDPSANWLVPNVFKMGGGMTSDILDEDSEIGVSGGSFEGDVSEFVEAGSAALVDENGAVKVLSDSEAEAQAKAYVEVDGKKTYYTSVDAAEEFAAAGQQVVEINQPTTNPGGGNEGTVAPSIPEDSEESEKTSTPKTGDAAPFAAVAGIAALAIAGVAVARRQMM